jgi:hypothetical protein
MQCYPKSQATEIKRSVDYPGMMLKVKAGVFLQYSEGPIFVF